MGELQDAPREQRYTTAMRRSGTWTFLLLFVLAVGLTFWLGPRPVYDLWEARRLLPSELRTFAGELQGPDLLREIASANGIEAGELPGLRPGDRLCDVDSDGDLDLLRPEIGKGTSTAPGTETELHPRLYLNEEGRFRDVTTLMGRAFDAPRRVVRTRQGPDLEVADLDGDRKLDVVLRSDDGSGWVLYNRLAARHALVVRVIPEGTGGGWVELSAGGRVQVRLFRSAKPVDARAIPLHFGLGAQARVEWLRVEWPSGSVTERVELEADQTIDVHESEASNPHEEEG